jgi:uncharacterized membrane protein YbhN (UPF0104 family)
MKFIDYLYIRYFLIYKKHKETPRFSSGIMFGILGMITFFFIVFFLNTVFTNHFFSHKNFEPIHGVIVTLIFGIFVIAFTYFRYTSIRILKMIQEFKNCKWNTIIPNWIILALPFIEFLGGLLLLKIIY